MANKLNFAKLALVALAAVDVLAFSPPSHGVSRGPRTAKSVTTRGANKGGKSWPRRERRYQRPAPPPPTTHPPDARYRRIRPKKLHPAALHSCRHPAGAVVPPPGCMLHSPGPPPTPHPAHIPNRDAPRPPHATLLTPPPPAPMHQPPYSPAGKSPLGEFNKDDGVFEFSYEDEDSEANRQQAALNRIRRISDSVKKRRRMIDVNQAIMVRDREAERVKMRGAARIYRWPKDDEMLLKNLEVGGGVWGVGRWVDRRAQRRRACRECHTAHDLP